MFFQENKQQRKKEGKGEQKRDEFLQKMSYYKVAYDIISNANINGIFK